MVLNLASFAGTALRGIERVDMSGPGTHELWVTSADMVIPLPDTFTFEQGALVEPASVAVPTRTPECPRRRGGRGLRARLP